MRVGQGADPRTRSGNSPGPPMLLIQGPDGPFRIRSAGHDHDRRTCPLCRVRAKFLSFSNRPLSCQSVDEITRRVSVHQTRSDHMGTCKIWALSRLPKIQTDISENTLCWLQQRNHPCRNLALARDHMVGADLFKICDFFV